MEQRGNPKWVKGVSANPGGRPRDGLAKILDRVCSPNAEAELTIISLIARGILDDPHEPGGFVRVPPKLRLEAATWIAERRHGKASQSVNVDVSGSIDHRSSVDLGLLAESELGDLERLLEKGHAPALVEGEIVPEAAKSGELPQPE